jgi:ABC-type amino acid transport substrate-binding protein
MRHAVPLRATAAARRFFRFRPRQAVFTALILAGGIAASGQPIRMAWFTVPPHMFPPQDGALQPTGPTIELFNAIAARMGCTVEWVGPVPLSRLDRDRETGELGLDGGVLTIKIEDWTRYLLYPKRPYFVAEPCFAVRSDNPIKKIETIRDIEGYRIGFAMTLKGIYPRIILDNRDGLVIDEITGEDWTSRNMQKLLEGRLDAVYELNKYTIIYTAATAGVSDKIKILLLPADPLDHYFVFNKTSPRARELLDAYERAVAGFPFDYNAMLDETIKREAEALTRPKER